MELGSKLKKDFSKKVNIFKINLDIDINLKSVIKNKIKKVPFIVLVKYSVSTIIEDSFSYNDIKNLIQRIEKYCCTCSSKKYSKGTKVYCELDGRSHLRIDNCYEWS